MTFRPHIFSLILLCILSCSGKDELVKATDDYQCKNTPLASSYTRSQLLSNFEEQVLEALAAAEIPNVQGAMGYFSGQASFVEAAKALEEFYN